MKRIGVKPTIIIDETLLSELKQHYLIFDSIGIPQLKKVLDFNIKRNSSSYVIGEIEYLVDMGIVEGVADKSSFMIKKEVDHKKIVPILNFFLKVLNQEDLPPLVHSEMYARFACFEIFASKDYTDTVAYPISLFPPIDVKAIAKKEDIIQIALNQIPVPDDSTPWEAIIDFKNDQQSMQKLKALQNWITDISKGNYSISEVAEKTQYLLEQYSECLRLHKLRIKMGVLQTLVVGTATFIENIAKLRLGEMAKFPFSFKERKIELLLNELQAPGNEIAYIYAIKEKFK